MPDTYSEKLFALVKEAFENDLKHLKESYTDDNTEGGRPSFWQEPSPEEQMMRWRDPLTRMDIERSLYETEGPQAVLAYRAKMNKLSVKQMKDLGFIGGE